MQVAAGCALADGVDEALREMEQHGALQEGVADRDARQAPRQRLAHQAGQQAKHAARAQKVLLRRGSGSGSDIG